MKIARNLLVYMIALIFVLVGCSQNDNTKTNTNKTVYIGDNSKVVQIVSELPYPKGTSYSTIEIQSDIKPYELKVFLNHVPKNIDGLKECANQAFDKISNMGIISFYDKDGNYLVKSYEGNKN